MALVKVRIDLNYIQPRTSFIYPLYSEEGIKILDARVQLSKEVINDFKLRFGNNVYYLKNVSGKTFPPKLLNEAAVESQDILEEITRTDKISKTSYGRVEQVVDGILSSLDFAELKAINLLKDIKSLNDYLFQHLVNVGILAAVFAKRIGTLSANEVRHLTLGAYLIDIGQTKIDPQLLKMQGAYNISDITKMRRHPQLGYEALKDIPEIDPIVLQTVLFHHERFNGKGYYNLPYDSLPFPPKLVALCDVYDALTSPRPHREAFTTSRAMKAIINTIDVGFDFKLVHDFIYHMGPMLNMDESIIARNDLCELSTGEIALVKTPGERNQLKPKIAVYCKFQKQGSTTQVTFLKHPIKIDLAHDTDRYIRKLLTNEKQISIIKNRLTEMNNQTDFS